MVPARGRRAERVMWAGLALVGLGLAALVVESWVVYLTTPGIGLVDGYWVGHEPWTSVAVAAVLLGSAVATPAAAATVVLRGGWLRRVLVLPLVGVPVLWWLAALGAIPVPRYRPPVPVAFAYSLPETAALLLLAPLLAIVLLAVVPRRPDRRVRLRRVYPADRSKPAG